MEQKHQLLLVEDDKAIAKSLKMSLGFKGFDVTTCETIQEGLAAFAAKSFDVVLLDVNLPDGSGHDLCRDIRRANGNVPILMLTARTDEQSAVRGIEGGADDYVRKPYGLQELTARINRLLERKTEKSRQPIVFGELRIEPARREAWAGETQVSLGKREFEILALLVRKQGEVVSRSDILNALGEEGEIYDRTIDSHLSHLRRKLKNAGAEKLRIASVYGVGYRLDSK